jgi:hypothetical protein
VNLYATVYGFIKSSIDQKTIFLLFYKYLNDFKSLVNTNKIILQFLTKAIYTSIPIKIAII